MRSSRRVARHSPVVYLRLRRRGMLIIDNLRKLTSLRYSSQQNLRRKFSQSTCCYEYGAEGWRAETGSQVKWTVASKGTCVNVSLQLQENQIAMSPNFMLNVMYEHSYDITCSIFSGIFRRHFPLLALSLFYHTIATKRLLLLALLLGFCPIFFQSHNS